MMMRHASSAPLVSRATGQAKRWYTSELPKILSAKPMPRELTEEQLIDMSQYEAARSLVMPFRRKLRKERKIQLGPYSSFTFEHHALWWIQTHEMLRAEKGGREQMEDELKAYGPLVPQPGTLVGTLMFEIADKQERLATLSQLGHVEDCIHLDFGPDERITAASAGDEMESRTTSDGKTSAVHFLKFKFSEAQAVAFKQLGEEARLVVTHKNLMLEAPLGQKLTVQLASEL